MSLALSPIAIAVGLDQAQTMLGNTLLPVTATQERILRSISPYVAALPLLRNFVKSGTSSTVEAINLHANEAGHGIQLTLWPNQPSYIGIDGITDLPLTWQTFGVPTMHRIGIERYPAFILDTHTGCDVVESSTLGTHVVVATANYGLEVRIMMAEEPNDQEELRDMAERLVAADDFIPTSIKQVLVPCVDLAVKPDISWLHGLKTPGDTDIWVVASAVQQVKLRLDCWGGYYNGADIGEAEFPSLASQGTTGAVDKPFVATVSRIGVGLPILAAYVTQEDWEEPAKP
jgi:hypothetical protein